MAEQSVIHSTFVIERNYKATPEKVFDAFADPEQKRRWFVETGGHTVEHYELDFRIGGLELARFKFKEGTPVAGLLCENDASYQDIVPNRRIVMASRMNIGGRCISAALVTVEVLPAGAGSQVILTHQGAFFEGADGPAMRESGWQKLAGRLADELAR